MRTWKVLSAAVIAFAIGWLGAEIRNADKLSPGSVIANSWIEHVTLLMDAQGEVRQPEGVMDAVEVTMESLSTALELHYANLSSEQKDKLDPYIERVRGSSALSDQAATMRVTQCVARHRLNADQGFDCGP